MKRRVTEGCAIVTPGCEAEFTLRLLFTVWWGWGLRQYIVSGLVGWVSTPIT